MCVYCVILVFPKLWGPNVPTGIITFFLGFFFFPMRKQAYKSYIYIYIFLNVKSIKFCVMCRFRGRVNVM